MSSCLCTINFASTEVRAVKVSAIPTPALSPPLHSFTLSAHTENVQHWQGKIYGSPALQGHLRACASGTISVLVVKAYHLHWCTHSVCIEWLRIVPEMSHCNPHHIFVNRL